ncbi:RNA polymerase III subunit C82 [Xanthoria parietina]
MSEYATQLSVVLVNGIFGELPSQVFHALAFNGRLSFSGLLHHTHFSPVEVRHSISVLIQQQLVYWYEPDNIGPALYEANLENSYLLARSGKYIQLLKDRFGDFASELVSNVIILGHVRIGDLTRTYFPSIDERGPLSEIVASDHLSQLSDEHPVKPNGDTEKHVHTVDELHSTISNLLGAGLLCLVHESYFRSAADNIAEAEHVVPRDGSIKSKKQQEATWELDVQQKLEDWRYGSKADMNTLAPNLQRTKRTFDGEHDELPTKKRKLAGLRAKGSDQIAGGQEIASSGWLDQDFIVRVNHEKLKIIMRNQQLVALAEESIGTATSTVYAELLRTAEPQLRKCKNELYIADDDPEIELATLPQVSTDKLKAIKKLLHDLPDLSSALGKVDPSEIDLGRLLHKSKKPKKRRKSVQSDADEASVEGSASSDESESENIANESESDRSTNDRYSNSNSPSRGDNDHPSEGRNYKTPDTTPDTTPKTNGVTSPSDALRQHLLLLSDQPQRFLIPVPRTKTDLEKWAVPYHDLSRTLLQNAIVSITISRFGPLAGRLIRILAANDNSTKLDEKMLVLLSLIPQKQMRTLLHSMHRAGHIELQEIPKDGSQRRPGMTLFYWFFDPDRCRKKMLEETYKTMTRLVQRARVEREGVRSTVEKAERTDVVGREEELLGEGELMALNEWKEKEERIWGEVGRLDELVAVLRDF